MARTPSIERAQAASDMTLGRVQLRPNQQDFTPA